jgi:hypothetical protein
MTMRDNETSTNSTGSNKPPKLPHDAPPTLPSALAPTPDAETSEGRVIRVEVPIRVQSPNRLHAEHPLGRARRVRRERAAVRAALDAFRPPTAPWLVTLVRVGPRCIDDDNAVAAMKGVRDEVAKWLGVSDRDPLVRFAVEQERGPYVARIEVHTTEA